jgi:hypothetical protein
MLVQPRLRSFGFPCSFLMLIEHMLHYLSASLHLQALDKPNRDRVRRRLPSLHDWPNADALKRPCIMHKLERPTHSTTASPLL